MIKRIEIRPRNGSGGRRIVLSGQVDIVLSGDQGQELLEISSDEFEGRQQLVLYSKHEDPVLHLRFKGGDLHHIRPGDADPWIVQPHQADPQDWLKSGAPVRKPVRYVVAADNANGEPDLYFCKIMATQVEIDEGLGYDWAKFAAEDSGYEPRLAYDCDTDSAGKAIAGLFAWDSAFTYVYNKDTNKLEETDGE